jgi:Cu(I)/Ag(I) efflux system membrane fusion protein
MNSKKLPWTLVALAFLIGVTLPSVLIWNPGHWNWADRVVTHVHHPAGETANQSTKQLWTCGMHPQVIQDHPGNCPICGMKLVPVKGNGSPQPTASAEKTERKIKYWRAPMDPNYISDKPGKSPMGMDLVPVYEDEATEDTGIRIDPNFIQNFGVRTAIVEKGSIPLDIRTIGILDYDQKTIVSVNTKFEGWIEKARVNYIGEQVNKGDVLFEIYSPQLVTTQQEYLANLDYVNKLSADGDPDAVRRARLLLEATSERLHYWDISDDQIAALRQSGKITRALKVLSPVSGMVVEKMGDSLEGMKVVPGMNVYKIADLTSLWADIQVFENQVQHLALGQTARITLDAFPGRRWTGKIIYINPKVDPKTRTLEASVEIANPDLKLRPQMYADVEIHTPSIAGAVKIPEEAVLHTGERNIVIVRKESGLFDPREVTLGSSGGGYEEIRSGLKAGETVVTSAQFLIDSESNLKEAINKILTGAKEDSTQKPMPKMDTTH